jgi:quercetin dioxygenase-like cupin family protein
MRITITAAVLLTALTATASAQRPATSTAEASEPRWRPAPAVFPPGAQMAVLQGDPTSAAPFTVRLRFPSGYRIAPHTHPTAEYLTVISGTFRVGMGTQFDAAAMTALPAGGFVTAPANEAHFAFAQGVTVVQIHSMGPFAMTYVNPAHARRAAHYP